jgi:transcriptional regulator NrdR family protein
MICPTCGQPSLRVLETRQAGDMARRRHVCIDNHRWITLELPEAALRGIGLARLQSELARVARGVGRRQQSTSRRELVAYMLEQGRTATEIAREAGCTAARVRQIRATLADEQIKNRVQDGHVQSGHVEAQPIRSKSIR